MQFIFSPEIQAGLASGLYEEVVTKAGVPLGRIRDAVTGHFVKGAPVGVLNDLGVPLQPFIVPSGFPGQNSADLMPMLNDLSKSVSLLQTTTTIIGLGTVATVALSAVNLWQIIKLRKDIATVRTEVRDGFIDIKESLKIHNAELIEHINKVAIDVEFQQHRTILSRAYGKFATGIQQLQRAVLIQDQQQRNNEITSIRSLIVQSLADYENSQIMMGISAPAYLRRRECVWSIEQALIMTYQLQGEFTAVVQYLSQLRQKIYEDLYKAIELIQTHPELDFLFPEIYKIYYHDLPALEIWLNHTEWQQTLEARSQHQLAAVDSTELIISGNDTQISMFEVEFYQKVQATSHFHALKDHLKLLILPELRRQYQAEIVRQAANQGWTAITMESLKSSSPLTIANLYHYFQGLTAQQLT